MAPQQQQEQQLLQSSTMMTMNMNKNNSSGSSCGSGSGNGSVFDCPTAPATASSSTNSDHHHPRTIIAQTTASSTGTGTSPPSTTILSVSPLSPYNNDRQEEEHGLEEGNDAPPQSEDHQRHSQTHSHSHSCCTSPTTVMTPSSPSVSATSTSCLATKNTSSGTNTVEKKKNKVVGTTGEEVVLVPGTPTGTSHDHQQQLRRHQQQPQPQQDDDGKDKDNLRNNKPKPQKPFFVFDDWLDELVPKDQTAAEQLAELLQTPEKQRPATPAAGNVPRTNNTKSQQRQHEKQQQRLSPILQFFFERFHRSDDRVHGSNIFATNRSANQSSRGRDTGGTKKHQDDDDHHQRRISSEPMLSSMKHGRGRNNNNGNDDDDDDDGFDDDGSIHSSPSPTLKVQQMPSTPKSSNKRRSILRRRRQYHHRQRQQQPQQVDPDHQDQSHNDDEEDYYCDGNSGGGGDGDGEDEYNFYYESPIGALPAPTKLEEQLDLASLDHHQAAPPGVPILDLGSSSSMNTREEDEELQRRHRNHLLRRRHRQKNPCIVRRSLELAQAWNLKGLHKAREASCSAEENNNGPSSPRRSWEDALAAWNNALEIITALLGKKHVQYAMIQNNRGIALGRLELYDEAFEALSVALEIRQSRLVVGRAVDNGTVSETNGTGAVQTEQQQQLQRCTGEDGDSVSTTDIRITTNNTSTFEEVVSTLHNLANVYQAKGDLPTALSVLGYARGLCFDAIEAENGKTAPGSTEVVGASTYSLQSARLCVAMGHVYWEASQYDDAHDAYQDAMQLYEHLAAETTRRNIINSRRYTTTSNNNNNQATDASHHYEVITAELQSLRVDIQELQGLREQQHCNYQAQLMRQHQLEGQCHHTSSAGNFFPIQN